MHYLSQILAATLSCDSHHEAAPDGFGWPMQAYAQGETEPMRDVAATVAERVGAANAAGRVYADTTHNFIKGLGWELMSQLDPRTVAVICLRQEPQKIVDSMLRINSVPLQRMGRHYILTPEKSQLLSPPPRFGLPGARGYRLARATWRLIWKWRRLQARAGCPFDETESLQSYQQRALAWYVAETQAPEQKFR